MLLRHPAWSAVALLPFFLSCTGGPHYSGTWELWTINGLPLGQAFPVRTELVGDFGGVELQKGDAWSEQQVNHSWLAIDPAGDFVERGVAVTTVVMKGEVYRRVTGQLWRLDDIVREAQPVDTTESVGSWRIDGDSIALFQTREQAQSAIAASIRHMAPTATEEQLRSAVAEAMSSVELSDRFRGTVEGDRLMLRDLNGRQLVYRRASADGR